VVICSIKALSNVFNGSKGNFSTELTYVRFTPESGHCRTTVGCPLCAKSGLKRRSKKSQVIRSRSEADIACCLG
jgi:hypothetical protein